MRIPLLALDDLEIIAKSKNGWKLFPFSFILVSHMPALFTPLTLCAALLTGCLGAFLAKRRGRNPYNWFFIGFFFGVLGTLTIFFAPNKKQLPAVATEPPLPTIQGPLNKFWYYLDGSHNQIGPMSHQSLTTEWRQGKISATTYVWHEELPEWKLLKDLFTSSP